MRSSGMPFPLFLCVVIAVAVVAENAFATGGAINGSRGNSNEFMSRFGTGMENCELMA